MSKPEFALQFSSTPHRNGNNYTDFERLLEEFIGQFEMGGTFRIAQCEPKKHYQGVPESGIRFMGQGAKPRMIKLAVRAKKETTVITHIEIPPFEIVQAGNPHDTRRNAADLSRWIVDRLPKDKIFRSGNPFKLREDSETDEQAEEVTGEIQSETPPEKTPPSFMEQSQPDQIHLGLLCLDDIARHSTSGGLKMPVTGLEHILTEKIEQEGFKITAEESKRLLTFLIQHAHLTFDEESDDHYVFTDKAIAVINPDLSSDTDDAAPVLVEEPKPAKKANSTPSPPALPSALGMKEKLALATQAATATEELERLASEENTLRQQIADLETKLTHTIAQQQTHREFLERPDVQRVVLALAG